MAQSGYYDRDRRPKTAAGLADGWTGDEPAGQMNYAPPHHSSTAEYQSSGVPFVFTLKNKAPDVQNVYTIDLPFGSRWIMVQIVNTGTIVLRGDCRIGFGYKGADDSGLVGTGNNYVNTQLTNQTRLELKCSQIQVVVLGTGNVDIQIIAGLTGVPGQDFPKFTNATDGNVIGINADPVNDVVTLPTP